MAELTGPHNCAECGTDVTARMVMEGDSGALVVTIQDDMVEVPGLYVCTDCAGAIMAGEREATVTPERAVAFLAENYLPRLAALMTAAYNDGDLLAFIPAAQRFMDCKDAAEALDPRLEIGVAMIDLDELQAADLPNGQRRSTIDQN